MKKRLSVSCILLSLILGMSACGDAAQTSADSTPSGTEAVTEASLWDDHLPTADLNGYEFRMTVYGNDEIWARIYVEEQDGNIVNDAVYEKMAVVEDRFNVDIVVDLPDSSQDIEDLVVAVMAGDDFCDIAQCHDVNTANAALEGLFVNLYDVPNLDFSQPWWPAETVESMTVAGQMYMMFNNISYTSLAQTRVMFFNKDLVRNLNLDFPYELVYNGTWTMDAMNEMCQEAYSDLNGNSKKDRDDQLGFAYGEAYCVFEPFKVEPYKKSADGTLYYEVDVDRIHKIVTKLSDILHSNGGLVAGGETNAEAIFADGRAMFTYTNLYAAALNFSQADNLNYGILPMPKLDETQEGYFAGATDRPLVIPITAEDRIDTIGLVVEAINIEGYKRVYPAYFEVTMKSRYADQSDDAQMLDIIHDNTIISFTYLYGDHKSIYNTLLNDILKPSKVSMDVASWSAKRESAQKKRVETIMEFFEDNK